MNPISRFLLATFGSALGSILTLVVTSPLYIAVDNEFPLGDAIYIALGVSTFALVIGLPVALLGAAAMGGAMLAIENRTGRLQPLLAWLLVGVGSGLAISLLFIAGEPRWPARMATAVWFAAAGAVGAWVFHWLHRRRRTAATTVLATVLTTDTVRHDEQPT